MPGVKNGYRFLEELIFEVVSEYGALKVEQLKKYFYAEEDVLEHKLKSLERKHRICYLEDEGIVKAHKDIENNKALLQCFWIIIDLGERVEHHFRGSYPLNILFYSDGMAYEVFYCSLGDELAMTHAIKSLREQIKAKTLVVVEAESQMQKLQLDHVVFCMISEEGEVVYYE